MLSNTFSGISPGSVAPFIAAELGGAAIAFLAIRALHPRANATPAAVVVLASEGTPAEDTA
jgi:hypothetical protein